MNHEPATKLTKEQALQTYKDFVKTLDASGLVFCPFASPPVIMTKEDFQNRIVKCENTVQLDTLSRARS